MSSNDGAALISRCSADVALNLLAAMASMSAPPNPTSLVCCVRWPATVQPSSRAPKPHTWCVPMARCRYTPLVCTLLLLAFVVPREMRVPQLSPTRVTPVGFGALDKVAASYELPPPRACADRPSTGASAQSRRRVEPRRAVRRLPARLAVQPRRLHQILRVLRRIHGSSNH